MGKKNSMGKENVKVTDGPVRWKETTRRRRADNNKIGHREMGLGDLDWNHLAQDRDQWRAFVITAMNYRVAYNFEKFLSS